MQVDKVGRARTTASLRTIIMIGISFSLLCTLLLLTMMETTTLAGEFVAVPPSGKVLELSNRKYRHATHIMLDKVDPTSKLPLPHICAYVACVSLNLIVGHLST